MPRWRTHPEAAYVDLYWLPLGAGPGGAVVRASGWAYERLAAARERRTPARLYHAALVVHLAGDRYSVEMAPAWGPRAGQPGVCVTGSVGLRPLGVVRAFRYEVRAQCVELPDLAYAIEPPQRVADGPAAAHRILFQAHRVPPLTWGRDELGAGQMWNSNSLVAWLLATSGVDPATVRHPDGGHAPGWDAGIFAAEIHCLTGELAAR